MLEQTGVRGHRFILKEENSAFSRLMSMPDDLNSRMEELLKAYAQKREADSRPAGELHSATRRLLHAEVQRSFPLAPVAPKTRPWILLWPRLAFGSALLGVLTFLIVVAERKASRGFSVAQQASTRESTLDSLPAAAQTRNRGASVTLAADELKNTKSAALSENSPAETPLKAAGENLEKELSMNATKRSLGDHKQGYAREVAEERGKSAALNTVRSQAVKTEGTESVPAVRTGSRAEAPAVIQPTPTPSASPPAQVLGSDAARKMDASRAFAKTPVAREIPGAPGRKEAAEQTSAEELATVNERSSAALDKAGKQINPGTVSLQSGIGNVPVEVLQFVQSTDRPLYRRNFQSPAIPDVLSTFQWERRERVVQIIDSDGSIYDGTITDSPQVALPPPPKETEGVALRSESSPVSNPARYGLIKQNDSVARPLFFSVVGTNLTLKQQVTFQGSLFSPKPSTQTPEADSRTQSGRTKILEKTKEESKGSSDRATDQTRRDAPPFLSGRANVGGSNEFQINARPR